MPKPIRVLIVEDSEDDAELLLRELRRGGYDPVFQRVDRPGAMRDALEGREWDVVLADYAMPRFDALAAFALVRERGLDLPFVIVSGAIGEEVAVEAMRAGVHDYLVKGKLARLVPVIERELREAGVRAERRTMREQILLSDRMASLGTLAAGVAHEINNPLMVLLGNLELAQRELGKLSDEYRTGEAAVDAPSRKGRGLGPPTMLGAVEERLREAHEAADRVREIVNDVKIFSRVDEQHEGPLNVTRVLESALRVAWNEIRHRARLVKDVALVPPVSGNEARLGQVFLNLLVNAAQAIPEGQTDRNEIRVTARSEGERVIVEVSDTGPGIPAESLGRVFEPRFTAPPPGLSSGVGLSLCQRIVTALGGRIEVESEVGRGSRFRVTLPAVGAERLAVPTAPEPKPAPRRGHILFVDDEPMLCDLVERLLEPEHEIEAMTSAQDALDRVTMGERYDLIFCDLLMPVMTGMDLYAALDQVAPDQRERMVFITGGAFTPKARAFLSRIPNPCLDKPFELGRLRSLVSERLARG